MSLPLGHTTLCLDKPGPCICATLTDTICCHPNRGWHRNDRVACAAWNEQVDEAAAAGRIVRINGYGWSDQNAMPITKETAMDLTATHTPGCATARTGKCICAYLAQWDSKPALTGPSQVLVDDAWKDWAAAEQDPDFWIDKPGFESGLSTPTLQYLGNVNDKEPDLARELSDEKLRTKYWHKEYKDLGRRFIGMSVIALAGWGFSLARGIWGF
jgi:hypothetical protein